MRNDTIGDVRGCMKAQHCSVSCTKEGLYCSGPKVIGLHGLVSYGLTGFHQSSLGGLCSILCCWLQICVCFILDAWLLVSSGEAVSYLDMAVEFMWKDIL